MSRRRFAENVGALAVLQAADYLLPFLVFPFLVRQLGAAAFGRYVFAAAVVHHLTALVDYGFALTAPRDVAAARDDRPRRDAIAAEVVWTKLLLLVLGGAGLALAASAVPALRPERPVLLACALAALGNALFPTWFFQGMERMRWTTLLSVGGRTITTILLFAAVRGPEDLLLAAGLQAGGPALAGVAGLLVARTVWGVRLTFPGTGRIRALLRRDRTVFASQLAVVVLLNGPLFVLGLVAPSRVVGQFGVADRLIRAACALAVPVLNPLYPRASVLFRESRRRAVEQLRPFLTRGSLAFAVVALGTIVIAEPLARLVVGRGESAAEAAGYLRLMSPVPLLVWVNNLYGTQVLLNVGRERDFMRAILLAAVVAVLSAALAVPTLGGTGAAIAVLLGQLCVVALVIVPVRRLGIRLAAGTAPEAA